MTKFQNPSFNSPANNSKYNDNYEKTFGKPCTKEKCSAKAFNGYQFCDYHLVEAGITPENPETD